MNRREFVVAGSVAPFLSHAYANSPVDSVAHPSAISLIDAHCHIFNASDLPVVRFIKIVVLENYPRQAVQALDVDDADVVDLLIDLLIRIVGRANAPSAKDELAVLLGKARPNRRNIAGPTQDALVIETITEFTSDAGLSVSNMNSSRPGMGKLRRALRIAAGQSGESVSGFPATREQHRDVVRKAYRSDLDVGLVLRWFALFTRYRFDLADQLVKDHRRQGFRVSMICPAVVDYDYWLGEDVRESPIPDQVEVLGQIARRKNGPRVHGYVGFDPLRQVAYDAGLFKSYNPLEVVERAVRDHGFLGVKLYPPMGFRPFGNSDDPCQTYPKSKRIEELLAGMVVDSGSERCSPRPQSGSRHLGQLLDTALEKLFNLCDVSGASVMAHANDSNGASQGYSRRADPAFWIPVFERWPALRVCLAHFGHFSVQSAAAQTAAVLPEASWEWTLGRFVASHPRSMAFADISYMADIVKSSGSDRSRYAATVTKWLRAFDPECSRVLYGTDWIMLGIDTAYTGYCKSVYDFFKHDVGLDDAALSRLFFENAIRFLGLGENDLPSARLTQFYIENRIPLSSLKRIYGRTG